MTASTYYIALTKDDNATWLVTSRDFPELTTFGESKQEALANARHALEEAIAARVDQREDIPSPSKAKKGEHAIQPGTMVQVKLAIYQAMRDKKVRQVTIARALGLGTAQTARILDMRHQSKLEQLEAVAGVLGYSLVVSVSPTTH